MIVDDLPRASKDHKDSRICLSHLPTNITDREAPPWVPGRTTFTFAITATSQTSQCQCTGSPAKAKITCFIFA